MIRTTPLLAVCLAAFALPALAQSQAYPFEEISRGSGSGGLSMAKQDLILSDQQLQTSGAAHLIPAGTAIDFSKDALLVVRMGSRNTGGYAIQIHSISVRPSSGSVPGGPAVSLTTQLRVKVVAQSPGPMDMVTKAFTSPYHVVKVPRPVAGGLVASFEISDAAIDFTEFSRNSDFHSHRELRRIEVNKDGSVAILEWGPEGAEDVDFTTTVDDRFIGQLRTVLGRLDFMDLPRNLNGPNPDFNGRHLTYFLGVGPGDLHRVTGDPASFTPDMRARLRPLDELLDAIHDEAVRKLRLQEFKGTVSLSGDDVVLSGPQKAYTLTGEPAKTVRMFAGETVKILGAITPAGDSMEIERILYPEHKPTLVGTLQISAAGSASLATGNSIAELHGPAAAAIGTANSFSLVVVDGWVFTNVFTGKIKRIYAASVEAKVTAPYSIILPRGWASRGESVSVLWLSRSGKWARVKSGGLVGFMRLSHLRIGEAPAIGPASSGPAPGLSGSIGK